jgi:hypothetical protein
MSIVRRLRLTGTAAAGVRAPRRLPSPVAFGALVVFALVGVEAIALATIVIPGSGRWELGMDYGFYRDVGQRWLTDGSYYLPHQLASPYDFELMVDVVYPPNALFLFVPFAVLPAPLWWLIPLAVLGWVFWHLRPAAWAWLVVALLLAWPRAIGAFLFGNSDIWVAAAVAGATYWGWPAVALVLKPTMLPLAIIAVRRRSFWIAAIGLGALSLAMLPLWRDYLTAMLNARIPLDYSLGSLPLALLPLAAWVGRSRLQPGTADPVSRTHEP